MPELVLGLSKGQRLIGMGAHSKQLSTILLGEGKEDFQSDPAMILFWRSVPVAVVVGSIVYHHQAQREQGATRAINALDPLYPRLAVAASQFDFVLGSLLTKTGLRLTAKE